MSLNLRAAVRMAVAGCVVFPGVGIAMAQVGPSSQIGPSSRPDPSVAPRSGALQSGATRLGDSRYQAGMGGNGGRILQSSMIIGSPVALEGGVGFGTVKDFVIGDGGCLQYAVVSYNNGLYPVPWGVVNYDWTRHGLMVGLTRDRIRDIPRLNNMAELNDARFSQRVQTFYRGNQNGVERTDRMQPRPETQPNRSIQTPNNRTVTPRTEQPGARSTPAPRAAEPREGERK